MEAAGLVVGVIPVGLKLIKVFRDYVKDLGSREEELKSAISQVEALNASLNTLKDALQQIPTMVVSSNTAATMCQALELTKSHMERLTEYLLRLQPEEDTDAVDNWKAKTNLAVKKLRYPVQRAELQGLLSRLSELCVAFNVALGPLMVHINSYQLSTLLEVRSMHTTEIIPRLVAIEMFMSTTPKDSTLASEIEEEDELKGAPSASEHFGQDTRMALTTERGRRSRPVLKALELNPRGCFCRRSSKNYRPMIALGPFETLVETTTTIHDSDCWFANKDQEQSSKRWVARSGYRVNSQPSSYLVSFLKQFSWYDAQWSVGTSIDVRGRVNLRKTPAGMFIRIMEGKWNLKHQLPLSTSLLDCVQKLRQGWSLASQDELGCFIAEKLVDLLHDTGGSPFDQDISGQTLLQPLWWMASGRNLPCVMSHSLQILPSSCRAIEDDYGRTLWSSSSPGFSTLIPIDVLLPTYMHSVQLPASNTAPHYGLLPPTLLAFIETLQRFPQFVNDLNMSSLSEAVLRNSMSKVVTILERSPSHIFRAVETVNPPLYPFEIAASGFPESMPTILRLCPDLLLSGDKNSFGGLKIPNPLNRLLVLFYCGSLWTLEEFKADQRHDAFAKAFTYVLSADCPIIWEPYLKDSLRCWLSDKPIARRLIRHLIQQLGDRRRRLAALCGRYLPAAQLEELDIHSDQPLDTNAYEAWLALQKLGVPLSPALDPGTETESVFLNIGLPEFAVCELASSGFDFHSALWNCVQDTVTSSYGNRKWLPHGQAGAHPLTRLTNGRGIEPIPWLFSHCCHEFLNRHISALPWRGTKILHVLAFWLASLWTDALLSELVGKRAHDHFKKSIHLLSIHVLDHCSCSCSSQGCLPITIFYNRATVLDKLPGFRWTRIGRSQDRLILPELLRSNTNGESNFSNGLDFVTEFIRCYTFNKLGCRHTCCRQALLALYAPRHWEDDVPDYAASIVTDEERTEIQDEDRDKLQLLEEIVDSLKDAWVGWNSGIEDFLRHHVDPKIDEALERLQTQKSVEETLHAMRGIGITITTEGPADLPSKRTILTDRKYFKIFKSAKEAGFNSVEWAAYEKEILTRAKKEIDDFCGVLVKDWKAGKQLDAN